MLISAAGQQRGVPYSVAAALEPGRTSWTAVLDAVRLDPDDDDIAVTAAQVRDVITRLVAAEHWRQGDPDILFIFDAGYDLTRLAWLLADLPAQVPGRLRSDRVMQLSAPPRQPGTRGRPRRHGGQLALADPATWPSPQVITTTETSRYGTAAAAAWDGVHARLTHRGAWLDHDGPLPVIDGTLIRLQAGHLPGDREPKPAWLWWSCTGAAAADVDRCWQAFLRRFDLVHLPPVQAGPGLDRPQDPRPGRCGPVDLADHHLLCPASPGPPARRRPAPALGTARPARPADPGPGRRGFRNIRTTLPCPASAPNPASPARAGRPDQRTATPQPVTTWGKRRSESQRSRHDENKQVKRKA